MISVHLWQKLYTDHAELDTQWQSYLGKIDALIPLELRHEEVDHAVVEILAAQEGVPVRGFHLEYA